MNVNGNMVTNTTDTLQEEAKFYRTLYTSQTNNIKTINIMNVNGNMVTNTTDTLQEEAKFYRTLYTSQTNNIKNINTYVNDTTVDYKLTNNEANSFEGLFTINECKYAVFIYAK